MSENHRIGVLSDTHIPQRGARLPDAVLRHFEDVELILHAGDLSALAVLDQLSAYAPVEAVQGNVEQPEVVLALPLKRTLVVGGCEIGLVHTSASAKTTAATPAASLCRLASSSSAIRISRCWRTRMA